MNTSKSSPKTTAYLRVSTIDQDIEKNKAAILDLANSKHLGHVVFDHPPISWSQRVGNTFHKKGKNSSCFSEE
jgi:hypothetical protein